MFDIIKLVFDICLFKKGPQDLPGSVWLLRLLLAGYIGIRALMLRIYFDWLDTLLQIVVEIFMLVGFAWIALYLARKLGRFSQMLAALLGADALISFFSLPAIASMASGHGGILVFSVMLGLIGWHWAVTGHIIRHALDKSLIFSLGLAFLYLLGFYQVMALLFPEVAGVE
jgi:hypothetical protein